MHIARHALLNIVKFCAVACVAQAANVGFGKALVFAFEAVWERNVAYQLLFHQVGQRQGFFAFVHAASIHCGSGQFVKGLAAACAQIENA